MEILNLEITDISDMGQGIGRIDGMVVFVDGALPGDHVKAKITQKKKKFIKAEAVEILLPSPNRVQPRCEFTHTCGGCPLMSLDYHNQLDIKINQLSNKLKRIGNMDSELIKAILNPVIPMKNPYNYRNKVEFAVTENGETGFFKPGTNKVVDIPYCYISSDSANSILKSSRSYFIQNGNPGIERITVRNSFTTGEVMVILHITHTSGKNPEYLYPLIEAMDNEINNMKIEDSGEETEHSLESVYIYDSSKQKNPYTLIAGKRNLNDEQSGLKFEVSPASFYQTNPAQATKLFDKVGEYAAPGNTDKVFDLYCGVGSIGLTLAGAAKEITGVEAVKDAVLDANRNAVINGVVNAIYKSGKVEEIMDELPIDDNSIILLDPPRAGCAKQVLESVSRSKTGRIIYVSCDPGTFARDVQILAEKGFKLERLTPVDMFPHTSHLETVAMLTR